MYCIVELDSYGKLGNCDKIIQCSKNKKELEQMKSLLSKKYEDRDFEVIEL